MTGLLQPAATNAVDQQAQSTGAAPRHPVIWSNLLFLVFAHLTAAFAIVYMAAIHFSWWTLGLGALWFALCAVSITGGYHRLFAHASYKAGAPLRLFYLLFGAASVQNSALSWSKDHRLHHAYTDQDDDPYSSAKGFWWSHILWVVLGAPERRQPNNVRDLEASRLVRFQHRYYVLLAIVVGALVPAAIGTAWGDPIGALLVAGFLRLVIQWHATFSINSFTHMVGERPFAPESSARDSFWVALLTMGEGYHNFHHRFPVDYRNGIRWYHFDPTKWFVWGLSKIGQTSELRRIPQERIEAVRNAVRAKMAAKASSPANG